MSNTFFINSLVLLYNFHIQMYTIMLDVFSFCMELSGVRIESNRIKFNLRFSLTYQGIVWLPGWCGIRITYKILNIFDYWYYKALDFIITIYYINKSRSNYRIYLFLQFFCKALIFIMRFLVPEFIPFLVEKFTILTMTAGVVYRFFPAYYKLFFLPLYSIAKIVF